MILNLRLPIYYIPEITIDFEDTIISSPHLGKAT